MTISAQLVKELRDKTGAGMMDCKYALTETKGNVEDAIDWLRKKGLSKAANKAGRVAADGLIGVAVSGGKGAIVEVNSETDFVARNDAFKELVRMASEFALEADGDLDKLLAKTIGKNGPTVGEHVKELIAKIGENMSLRRTATVAVKDGVVASYVHNAAAPGMGKIGVLVALKSTGDKARLIALGRQIAMHVAAASPLAVSEKDLDPKTIERERAVFLEQAKASGKPAEIVAKMVEGRLKKEYFQQVVLMQQVFVVDGKETVGTVIKAAEKDIGAPIEVTGFVRYALGEGIARKTGDFAAEVAAMTKS